MRSAPTTPLEQMRPPTAARRHSLSREPISSTTAFRSLASSPLPQRDGWSSFSSLASLPPSSLARLSSPRMIPGGSLSPASSLSPVATPPASPSLRPRKKIGAISAPSSLEQLSSRFDAIVRAHGLGGSSISSIDLGTKKHRATATSHRSSKQQSTPLFAVLPASSSLSARATNGNVVSAASCNKRKRGEKQLHDDDDAAQAEGAASIKRVRKLSLSSATR